MSSSIFYSMTFSITLGFASFGIFLSLMILNIILKSYQHRTISNMYLCHTCLVAILFFCCTIIHCVAGFSPVWAMNKAACIARAFCILLFYIEFIYSHLLQSIIRFISTVYHHKLYSRAWYVHFLLIATSWIISSVIPIKPFLAGAYRYEAESQLCICSLKIVSSTLCILIFGFVLPYAVTIGLSAYVLHCIRASARRVAPLPISDGSTRVMAKRYRRELRGLKCTLIQLGIYALGHVPVLILAICSQIPSIVEIPGEVYLFSYVLIPISTTIILITVCITNHSIRRTLMLDRRLSMRTHD